MFHRKITSPVTVPCDFQEARKLPSLSTSMVSLDVKFPGKGVQKGEVIKEERAGGWGHLQGTEGSLRDLPVPAGTVAFGPMVPRPFCRF